MHTERSVKAALLQAKMEKTYTDSTQYFLEDPNKRISHYQRLESCGKYSHKTSHR
jgi:hypothetical protein